MDCISSPLVAPLQQETRHHVSSSHQPLGTKSFIRLIQPHSLCCYQINFLGFFFRQVEKYVQMFCISIQTVVIKDRVNGSSGYLWFTSRSTGQLHYEKDLWSTGNAYSASNKRTSNVDKSNGRMKMSGSPTVVIRDTVVISCSKDTVGFMTLWEHWRNIFRSTHKDCHIYHIDNKYNRRLESMSY